VHNGTPEDVTPEQALAQIDETDLAMLKGPENSAAFARGEGVVVAKGDIKLNMHDPLTHYDERQRGLAPRMPGGSSGSMTVLNTDFVVGNQAKISNGIVANTVFYAELFK
jgi:hypothetical protein